MLFDVASIQQNFVAARVLKLVENGVLPLDDPIAKYLATYPNVDGQITLGSYSIIPAVYAMFLSILISPG